MEQMRMDPKHQFAAQYVLRAANERRVEREALLAAAAMNINMSHFASTMSTMTTGTISGSGVGGNSMLGAGGGGGGGGGGGTQGGGLGGITCSPTGKRIVLLSSPYLPTCIGSTVPFKRNSYIRFSL